MVPTIPPEIWRRIAQFIPSSILRNLYSLNPVFLDLALNERYSDINLAFHWTAATATLVNHLHHPHVAHRVRRLTLASNWVDMHYKEPFGEDSDPLLMPSLAWYLPFDLGRFVDPFIRGLFDVNALMKATVVNFSNLSSLIIYEGGPSPQTQPDPLLLNSYTACASNLRTLDLFAKSANFHALFPPNAFELTSLEEVTLAIPQDDSSADAEATSTFFRAIASTLTTLNLAFFGTSDKHETPRLLRSFPCQRGKTAFPKLRSFSLFHMDPPDSPTSNIMQFLNQHADTLKFLCLQHTKPSPFASQSLDDLLVLPHLETLNILSGSSFRKVQELSSSVGLDVVRAYIQHPESTLTSLGLAHCSFTLHDLDMLLDLLKRVSSKNAEGGGLKSLTVTVQVLSPQALDMLAEKLPQLERLTVRFADLRSNDGADVPTWTSSRGLGDLTHEDIERFHLELKTRSYLRWSLRSFEIYRECLEPDTAKAILMPLAPCIPHLVEIGGGQFMKMSREPGSSIWKANDVETRWPALYYFKPYD